MANFSFLFQCPLLDVVWDVFFVHFSYKPTVWVPFGSKTLFLDIPFPEKIATFDYDSQMKVLKVTKNGSVRWKSYYWVYVSAALEGKYIGALNIGNGIWRVFYRNVFLGYFNENELKKNQ